MAISSLGTLRRSLGKESPIDLSTIYIMPKAPAIKVSTRKDWCNCPLRPTARRAVSTKRSHRILNARAVKDENNGDDGSSNKINLRWRKLPYPTPFPSRQRPRRCRPSNVEGLRSAATRCYQVGSPTPTLKTPTVQPETAAMIRRLPHFYVNVRFNFLA